MATIPLLMRSRGLLCILLLFLGWSHGAGGAENKPAPTPSPSPDPQEELFAAGKELFDQYAPAEVKEQFDFPTPQQWDQFAGRLQQALESQDLDKLGTFEPEARAALTALKDLPDYTDYAEWLEARLDYIEAARQTCGLPTARVPTRPPATQPGKAIPPNLPYYDLWLRRIQSRPVPSAAAKYLPVLRAAFQAEGVPAELVWLAEAESTFSPGARSPSGAKGLFQLMPETAKGLGLSTWLPDERTDPARSARAAAHYLHGLHERFGDWPLAIAAYNAGEGRIRRLLDAQRAKTFAEIAPHLPAETRMYVPKVFALMWVRAGGIPG